MPVMTQNFLLSVLTRFGVAALRAVATKAAVRPASLCGSCTLTPLLLTVEVV